jgi:hypothetical protein
LVAKVQDIRNDMQWIADHWFELATIALLAVIAINTLDSRWNNATIVEQLNDIIRRFSLPPVVTPSPVVNSSS